MNERDRQRQNHDLDEKFARQAKRLSVSLPAAAMGDQPELLRDGRHYLADAGLVLAAPLQFGRACTASNRPSNLSGPSLYAELMQPGRSRLATLKAIHRPLLAVVAFALIGAQCLGLVHRIKHGTATGWIHVADVASHEHEFDHAPDHAHSSLVETDANAAADHECASFDALALGSGSPGAALVLHSHLRAPAASDVCRHQRRASSSHWPFQARAPPAAFS